MVASQKQVLIIDNATTCAMRIKTLVNIHGGSAQILHWSDWQHLIHNQQIPAPCLVIIEESVPLSVIDSVVDTLADFPLFLLIKHHSATELWAFDKPITPIVSSLSNFEMVSLLQPYWREDTIIALPNVLVLDDQPHVSYLLSQNLSEANIPCRISDDISNVCLSEVDMVLVKISDFMSKRHDQLLQLKLANPAVGVIAYGTEQDLTNIDFVQFALREKVDLALTLSQLEAPWLASFYQVWHNRAESKEQQRLTEQVEESLDNLLEKSLVMQVLFSSSMDGVVSFDNSGQILKLNNGFCELVGDIKTELLQSNIFDWLALQSKHELQDLLVSEHLVQQQVLDLQIQHKHQINIPVSASINKINVHGEFVFVAVMRNNTSSQLQHKLLIQKNSQLEHRARELKRQVEISADLTRINQRKRSAFMLHLTNYMTHQVKPIDDETKRKVSNIAEYYRIQSKQRQSIIEAVNVSDILKQVLTRYQNELKAKSLEVNLEVSQFLQVAFDREQIIQVFDELLRNAIEFSHKSTSIVISHSLLSSQHTEITISDVGLGILEHKQIQLFDLYESNSNGAEHLSTGLPLVRSLLHSNGGEVYVDNHYLNGDVVGVVFKLKLPIA